MKTQTIRCLLAAALAAIPGAIQAQPDAHYLPGLEGIKGASLPPPGFYFKDYNVFYEADSLNNGAGNSAGPANLQSLTLATVPRAIWITPEQFLGGNVGVDALLPIMYHTLSFQIPVKGRVCTTAAPWASATSSPRAPFPGIRNNSTWR